MDGHDRSAESNQPHLQPKNRRRNCDCDPDEFCPGLCKIGIQVQSAGSKRTMKSGHGLSTQTIARIGEVLVRFPEVDQAILFGSRARKTHRPGSDIDLALIGAGLDWRTVGRIYDALDDLLLPYDFSLITYDEATD